MDSVDHLDINIPDDFHHHLRDNDCIGSVLVHASQNFGRIIAMPNTVPPIRTVDDALAYHARIMDQLPTSSNLKVMMTLYLTDKTTPEEIRRAKETGIVYAVKLYPAGATTNSEFGVENMGSLKETLLAMSDISMPLLVHGEVPDPTVDIFDREAVFIDNILRPMRAEFPNLKIVMEHITTSHAVDFVLESGPNTAATITAHHLLYNRSDIFKGGKIHPHLFCLPVLKRERHRQALVQAATSGNPKFFLGTDSAPHGVESKECACGCAGVFTAHAAMALYAEAFEENNALQNLNAFSSQHGADFYGIERNTGTLRLRKESWTVPRSYQFGSTEVIPLRAGETVKWKIVSKSL